MLDLLHTPLIVLHIFVCLMLMLVVLIQPGKSGGLGAALGGAGAQQIFGGRGAGNFLTRTTWIAASIFFLTSVTLAYLSTSTGDSLEDLERAPNAAPSDPAPAAPSEPPAGAAPSGAAPSGAVPSNELSAPASPASTPSESAPSAPPSQP